MTDLVPHHARPLETWAGAREAYLAGLPAELVAERYGVSLSAVRIHARVEGWRRADQPAAALPPPDDPLTDDDGELDPADLSELARRHAARAIRRGRAAEAERWTRLAERWDRASAAMTMVSAVELDGIARLARTAGAVGRQHPAYGAQIELAMRRAVSSIFGTPGVKPTPHPVSPAPHGSAPPSPPSAAALREAASPRPLHGLHGLHGAVSPAALTASLQPYLPARRGLARFSAPQSRPSAIAATSPPR